MTVFVAFSRYLNTEPYASSCLQPSICMAGRSECTYYDFLLLCAVFLTGTDRIPINGFERMGVMIQRMDGGPFLDKLPVAHTCFNILDLPPYPSKEKMRDKLLQATNLTAGFGII